MVRSSYTRKALAGAGVILAAALGTRVFPIAPPGVASAQAAPALEKLDGLTHGPILGGVTATSVRVWGRTRVPSELRAVYAERDDLGNARTTDGVKTTLEHDNTGWVEITGLKPQTKYYYALQVDGRLADTRVGGRVNSFSTLPDAEAYRDPKLNPKGLFNFAFEFGCCNNQSRGSNDTPAYATMLRQLKDKVAFHVVYGDWIYEEGRETTAEQWAQANGVTAVPPLLSLANGITGVWENYKIYLSRSSNLANFHREVPGLFMFDDHEILNDIPGAGEVGLRVDARSTDPQAGASRFERAAYVRRSVFRDPAVQAWEDYLGWANPDARTRQPIRFGTARLAAHSRTLTDESADFSRLDLTKAANLHVLWGHGNTGVYEITRVLDRNRLEINPPADFDEEVRYSIGANHYFKAKIGNTEFFALDTRSYRTLHQRSNPRDPKTSILGRRQFDWLIDSIRKSDADFLFIASTVNFTLPHDNGAWTEKSHDDPNKDEAWTAYVDEREKLIQVLESVHKPALILTGDMHNSFAVQVTPSIWEFASAAHSSNNHLTSDAGGAPVNGPFDSRGRRVQVRWGTGFLDDSPRRDLRFPTYAVVQVNNVYNSPSAERSPRWVAYPVPQVVVQFYDGLTGDLRYAESVPATAGRER